MSILNTCSIVLAVVLMGSTVCAQDLDENRRALAELEHAVDALEVPTTDVSLPTGTRCTVGGTTFQCFTLGEFRLLLQLGLDLQYYTFVYENALAQSNILRRIVAQLDAALLAAEDQIGILQEERDRLVERWTEENRLRLEAENRPMFGSWIAWTLVAAEAVALATLSVVIAAQR